MIDLKWNLKRIVLAVIAFLMLSAVLPIASPHVYADNPETSGSELYMLVGEEKVYVLEVEEKGYYLFLPSEADTGNISLSSGNGDQVLFPDGDGFSEAIDISGAFDKETNTFETDILITADPEDPDASETVHLVIMKGRNIGTVFYHSDDIENNGIVWVEKDRNNRGKGTALVTGEDGEVLYNGKIDDIHIRGTSSIYDPKKGYAIKLSKKTALAGEEKGKKWVLLAMYKDPLRIDDMIMKGVARVSGDTYAADDVLVNLYYDGCYRGVYCLSEKNEIKSNRVDITNMEDYYEEQYPDYGETQNFGSAQNSYNNKYYYQKDLEGPSEL
ncbi:MAG: CotH kinase family protein, partial [Erysipelotrichaceae bacterium]|nr:CotH kinase family protein [Erysipelotrichaceae bacterium]